MQILEIKRLLKHPPNRGFDEKARLHERGKLVTGQEQSNQHFRRSNIIIKV
jgi:hypothetical protein